MDIIFFMIGVSLLMALGFLGAFFWSMSKGQNDDLHTPSIRILLDDDNQNKTMKNQPKITTNFELKRCKCEKECGRCKAIKISHLDKLKQI